MCKKREAQIFAVIMLGLGIMGAGIQENPPEPKGSTPAHEMETEITISQEKRKEQKKETALDWEESDTSMIDLYESCGMNLAKQKKNEIRRDEKVYYVNVDIDETDWPGDLVAYLKQALKDNSVEEYLEMIPSNYRKVEEGEKAQLVHGAEIAYFEPLFDEEDLWYLFPSVDEEDVLVVCRLLTGGYQLTYIFENSESSGYVFPVLTGGGQRNSLPYFIQWEEENYIAFPYWNKDEDRIVGVAVYRFGGLMSNVITIGRNSDGTFQVLCQDAWYDFTGKEGYTGEVHYEVPWIEVY